MSPIRFSRWFAVLAACLSAITLPSKAAQQEVLKGHVPPVTRKLAPLKHMDPNAKLHLAIGLPLRNKDKLTNLLEELYRPGSTNFRKFLSADEFAAKFGPSQADHQAVIDFAKAHNLTVTATHPNRTLVDVIGSVGDIEKAFHLHMQVYKHPKESRNFYAPDSEPTLDLAIPVLAISGLDNYKKPRPSVHTLSKPLVRPDGGGSSGGGTGGGSGSSGSYYGYDFRDAYTPGISLTGQGQSIGLFELTGYAESDISDYESETGLPNVNLVNVLVDNFDGNDDTVDYAEECTVDIEMAISMAPGLDSVIVYEGPTPLYDAPEAQNAIQYSSTTAEINDVLNRMATDNAAKQLSCSYQMDLNLSTMQIFQQYAAQGQSFFQASGDSGAYPAAVDEPADNPYVTVVGGTTLSTSSGAWRSEVVWLTPAGYDPLAGYTPEVASGGGISQTFPIPGYQQDVNMSSNQGSTTMRNLPDVAMIANNIDIVFGNDAIGMSFDFIAAGTSLATPLWAGYMALVNQQAALNGQPPIGFANPALYAIGKSANYHSCFHDITTGSNTNANSPSRYNATAGYDLCTGWGSMSGANLMTALMHPPTEMLSIMPPLGFTAFGPGGGPFNVNSQTYTLQNIGTQPLNWTTANSAPWLNVSASGGTLNPGASTSVTVSLNSLAYNYVIASYSGNVAFMNTTAGTTQNRPFSLDVGNGGFETGDFTYWNYVGDTNLTFALAADDVDVAGTNALDTVPDEAFVHSGLYGAYLGSWPTNGYLTHSLTTRAGEPLLVSFWLTCVPDQGSTTPNGFVAKWNGAPFYYQTNLPAFGWTNLQFTLYATGPSSALEFDFNNTPGAFGLDDVTVQTTAPVLQSAVGPGGKINFSWSANVNATYQLQSTTDLVHPAWINVGSTITATNTVASTSVPIGSGGPLFYRLEMLGH